MLGMNRYRLRSRTRLKDLPPELFLKILRLLPLQNLKSAVLVNKEWNSVGENPLLWSWAVLRVSNREDIAKLSVRRLARLREIKIGQVANWGIAEWELFFQNVEKLAQVKDIRGLRFRDLKGVDSGLLSRALKVVENVELWSIQLTAQQLTSIFNLIVMRETKIKKLELVHQDLKAVDSILLARALSGLEDVRLWASVTSQQITSIFHQIVAEDTKIKKLELGNLDLKDVDSGLLARALSGLEDVRLGDTKLTSQQITSIVHHIAMEDTKIKKLVLGGQDLSVVPTNHLAVAVSKLESVEFTSNRLTTAQVTSILVHIVEKDTKINILSLRSYNLSGVDGNLLNRAMNKLSQSGGILVHY